MKMNTVAWAYECGVGPKKGGGGSSHTAKARTLVLKELFLS